MSSSTSPVVQNGQPPQGVWSTVAPYVVSPCAAAVAIFPAVRHLAAKSALQRGLPVPSMTFLECLTEGVKMAPTVGVLIGAQMALKKVVESALVEDPNRTSFASTLASSAIVGFVSSPIVVVFNGKTMKWSVRKSLQALSVKQALAVSAQEAAFVAGVSGGDLLAERVKPKIGDSKIVEYIAAFVSGAAGSLAGHPTNTMVTRWQNNLTVDSFGQSMWGSARKAYGIGLFAVGYKFGQEVLNSTVVSSK